jgi:hypothetical protein
MKPVTKWLALLGVIIILAGGAIPLISTWPKTSTESNALTPAANPTEFTDQVQSEENPPPPTTEPAQPNRLETPIKLIENPIA